MAAPDPRLCCAICSHHHDAARRPFLCAVDAQSACYMPRMQLLGVLVGNDALTAQIEADAVKQGAVAALDQLRSKTEAAAARTKAASAAAAALRAQIAIQREYMATRRAALERRRDDLTAAGLGLEARRAHQMDETRRVIGDARAEWAKDAEDLARTRSFLCREAAKLFGPARVRRPGSPETWAFEIGHLEVIDITNMNNYPPEYISTSLANIAHLLVLIAHYLSIRLPAEITLPHKDYPRPTIFTIESSYSHSRSSAAGMRNFSPLSTAPSSHGKSATGSNARDPPSSPSSASARNHPRPLFITKPLATLYKDDPDGYSAFIEACALLAYDVAWLCISQGMVFSDHITLEEATNMGLNLYTLLFSERPPMPPRTVSTPAENPPLSQSVHPAAQTHAHPHAKPEPNRDPALSRFSHGSVCNFLHEANGFVLSRMLRFPVPRVIHERLQTKLIIDLALPEWELLDTHEWQVEDAPEDADAVIVSAALIPEASGRTSAAAAATRAAGPAGDGNINASPWTKVRSYARR
ncbi:uncharacterized protein BROUX77_007231 [Berkeleyomyces rouxiae]|uniref:uncharacterized protein n=1 Tax=Berkeleyomyces rouxiae TaxID=2035830 RepID=UPI003B7B0DC8